VLGWAAIDMPAMLSAELGATPSEALIATASAAAAKG